MMKLIDKILVVLYTTKMIKSFGDKNTEIVFKEIIVRRIDKNIQKIALRKLRYIDAATRLDDLKVPPGNKLEPLKGDLDGFYSIRINDQFRIIFKWTEGNAYQVEITDYH